MVAVLKWIEETGESLAPWVTIGLPLLIFWLGNRWSVVRKAQEGRLDRLERQVDNLSSIPPTVYFGDSE